MINGYEDIEAVFGLYTHEEALDKALLFREVAARDNSDASNLPKELGGSIYIREPDQVCIAKFGKNDELECACADFENLPQEKT